MMSSPASSRLEWKNEKSVFLLVDGHNVAYRAFHAIASMNAPDGQPTQALFGFVRTLNQLVHTLSATHVCVVFDGGIPESRLALLKEYKAHRPPMPEALRSQFPLMEQYLDARGIRWIRPPGEEADDLLATLARSAEPEVARVYLASTDRDLMQQVNAVTHIIEPSRKARITDAAEVERKTGVPPVQVLSWRALVGDPSDNIPGVPGIGPKTAARLLRKYGSLEAIWSALETVEPTRIRNALSTHRERVERNRALIRLNDHTPCPLAWNECITGVENAEALQALFRRVGFKRFLREQEEPRLL